MEVIKTMIGFEQFHCTKLSCIHVAHLSAVGQIKDHMHVRIDRIARILQIESAFHAQMTYQCACIHPEDQILPSSFKPAEGISFQCMNK